jgi:hypothetical protein
MQLAIKTLEQEPCEDAISRQEVLDMTEDMTDQFGNKHRVVTEGLISMLPPVTPKPKTDFEHKAEIVISQLRIDKDRLQEAIKALGEDMRKCQKLITDEEVLIGFNMAVALCNKHLAESEDKE